MEHFQALGAAPSASYAFLAHGGCDLSDGGRRASLLKRSQSSGSASTSRLVLENKRGMRSARSRTKGGHKTSCSAAAPGNRNSLASQGVGPGTFVLTEKILHLWNAQPRSRRGSWASNVATVPPPQEKTVESPKVDSDLSSDADSSSSFDWKTNWYPVSPEIDIDKSVPYPFHVLGRKVVIWHDGKEWNCVLDACPHRLAPLSEGRIDEQGCIQCSYHGWSFKADGSCANIPQARTEGPEAVACDQRRARAVVLPITVQQGILFVWPDEDSPDLARKTEPPITPGIDEEGWSAVGTFRDLAYNYDTGVENLVDPSHVPVAHHNVNGGIVGKRSQASPLNLEVTKMGPSGFEAQTKKVEGPPSINTFDAPARFTYRFQLRKIEGAQGATTTYCTPTAPGYSRILVVNARNFMTGLSSGPNWWQFFPRWLDHQLMLNLLDGDIALLHGQERYLREKTEGEVGKWNKAYFMPTTADRFVGAFRQWLNKFGGKGVKWAEGVNPSLPPPITKKQDLLDRYTTHTKQCRVCSQAVRNFELARKLLFVLAACFLGVGAVLANPTNRMQAVSFATIAGLVGWWLGGWIQMFYYKGYDHARIP